VTSAFLSFAPHQQRRSVREPRCSHVSGSRKRLRTEIENLCACDGVAAVILSARQQHFSLLQQGSGVQAARGAHIAAGLRKRAGVRIEQLRFVQGTRCEDTSRDEDLPIAE